MKKLTLKKINEVITHVASREHRHTVSSSVVEAYYEPDTNRLNIVGKPWTDINSFARVRSQVASILGLSDIFEGSKGYRNNQGVVIGHFVPKECRRITS
jgi:hypothetical protein